MPHSGNYDMQKLITAPNSIRQLLDHHMPISEKDHGNSSFQSVRNCHRPGAVCQGRAFSIFPLAAFCRSLSSTHPI